MATDVRVPTSYNIESSPQSGQWCAAVHAALIACGLVQTADTGQVTPSALGPTSTNNATTGFLVYRFNDTLQATAPVFIKVEFGAGNWTVGASGKVPQCWITVGTGTNGAGTITGVQSARIPVQMTATQAASTIVPANFPIWTSGGANRIAQVQVRSGVNSGGNGFWAVERTKDASGNDTNEGVHIITSQDTSGTPNKNYQCQTIIFAIATAQALAAGPMCVVNNDGTATDAGNTGFYPWQMSSKRGGENPPMNVLSYWFGDLAGSADVIVSVYGVNHTYRTLGADAGQANTAGMGKAGWRPTDASVAVTAHASVHMAMRWE